MKILITLSAHHSFCVRKESHPTDFTLDTGTCFCNPVIHKAHAKNTSFAGIDMKPSWLLHPNAAHIILTLRCNTDRRFELFLISLLAWSIGGVHNRWNRSLGWKISFSLNSTFYVSLSCSSTPPGPQVQKPHTSLNLLGMQWRNKNSPTWFTHHKRVAITLFISSYNLPGVSCATLLPLSRKRFALSIFPLLSSFGNFHFSPRYPINQGSQLSMNVIPLLEFSFICIR